MSCPDCFKGGVHEGTPSGITTRLHGLDTYVAEPASGRPPKGIIVVIPDAFGWEFVNIRLMADGYAKKQDYRVYAPDFMNGNSAPLYMLDSMKLVLAKGTWFDTLAKPYHIFWVLLAFAKWGIPNRFAKSFPIVQKFMENLRRNEGAHIPVGIAGFCWGGKHTLVIAGDFKADGKPLVDAAFTAHPSFLSLYDDIKKIRAPTSFGIGDLDSQVSPEQAEKIRDIIEAKPEAQKGEMRMYHGYGHGFACRVDAKNDDPRGAAEAEDQALAWFEKHFANVRY
ncbi:Uu.00g131760.m01.CDS01 [Anthostomella pinea]|uniref:Uu.00g131760.m01.CDS01 n=1 Tax=Anthostomella pinea TaxID=933095 RepID=A0AAI8VDN0_9PEZI|nr:Uu.00g131760.m01.CDS01 [Anthostomella pinea]